MSKQITAAELAEIVTDLLTNHCDDLNEVDPYSHFMTDIANVVAAHCGGQIVSDASPQDGVWYVGVESDECLPDDGGVWKNYDPEGEL